MAFCQFIDIEFFFFKSTFKWATKYEGGGETNIAETNNKWHVKFSFRQVEIQFLYSCQIGGPIENVEEDEERDHEDQEGEVDLATKALVLLELDDDQLAHKADEAEQDAEDDPDADGRVPAALGRLGRDDAEEVEQRQQRGHDRADPRGYHAEGQQKGADGNEDHEDGGEVVDEDGLVDGALDDELEADHAVVDLVELQRAFVSIRLLEVAHHEDEGFLVCREWK